MAEDVQHSYGWIRRADQEFEDQRDQNLRPKFHQVRHLVPLGIRYSGHFLQKYVK